MTLDELVTDSARVVSLPSLYTRINELLEQPDTTAAELAAVIEQDPGLSIRLLKIANSSAYGLSRQVDTVARAVSILGNRQIHELVLATTAVESFAGIPNELVSMENFWSHSISCAIAAKALAQQMQVQGRDSAFLCGLLHDIGQLIIFHALPEQSRTALMMTVDSPEQLEQHRCEQKVLGFDHAQAGAALARLWNLPESLIECIEFHHEPDRARGNTALVAIVHIANSLAVLAELHSDNLDDAPVISPNAWKASGLEPGVVGETVARVQAELAEVKAALLLQ